MYRLRQKDNLSAAEDVRQRTGLKLSPYFSAAKLAWIMEHVEGAAGLAARGELCCGTMDSYLVYRLTIPHRLFQRFQNPALSYTRFKMG